MPDTPSPAMDARALLTDERIAELFAREFPRTKFTGSYQRYTASLLAEVRAALAQPATPAPLRIGTTYCCERAVGTGRRVCVECADSGQAAATPAEPVGTVEILGGMVMLAVDPSKTVTEGQPLYAVPVAQDDARDAARYRWLRGKFIVDRRWGSIALPTGCGKFTPEETDATVDAAIRSTGSTR